MLTKDLPVQIKAGPDDGLTEGTFTAYASVFGNVDSYGDRVVKGAFAKDLERWEASGNPIPLLFGHNMSDPDFNIGHVTATEDDHGLLVEAQLDLENPKAAQVYRLLKGRRINQMSFAYDVLDAAPASKDGDEDDQDATDRDVTELRELRVYEVSVVTIGANQETEVLAVKATAQALAAGAKAGRALSAANEKALREANSLIDSVLASLDDQDGNNDQEKASGTPTGPNAGASDTKSSVSAEGAPASPSARALAAHNHLSLT